MCKYVEQNKRKQKLKCQDPRRSKQRLGGSLLVQIYVLNSTTEEELKSPLSIFNTDWINFTISS